jgi:hypothetical protein
MATNPRGAVKSYSLVKVEGLCLTERGLSIMIFIFLKIFYLWRGCAVTAAIKRLDRARRLQGVRPPSAIIRLREATARQVDRRYKDDNLD